MSHARPCPYCGDAQASHLFLWIDALLHSLISRLPSPEAIALRVVSERVLISILNTATAVAIAPLRLSKALVFVRNPHTGTSGRVRSIWTAARSRGYVLEQAVIIGYPSELCRVRRKKGWHYFNGLPDILAREYFSIGNIDDKEVFKKALMHEGLPVPRGDTFLRKRAAQAFFQTLGRAIVKPRYGSRARHTSLDIREKTVFVRALKRAWQISPWCIVEEFIPGDLYRATCVDGKLIGVVHFIKPAIVADGVHTTRELLDTHNAHKKFPNLTDVQPNQLFTECLERQGLTQESVPEKGRTLLLAEHSERPNGGYFIDCTDEIPDENRVLIEKAARITGSAIIGLDIISRDLTRPHTKERCVFIEGNRLPFIELHDIPYEGTPRSVAAAIWDLWEKSDSKRHSHEHQPHAHE